jgi:GAF domain-containing protein
VNDEALAQASAAVARAEAVPELLSLAAGAAANLVGGKACAVSRIVGDVLVSVAEHTPSGRSLSLGQGFLVSDFPLTREVIERRRIEVLSVADEDADPAETELLKALGFEALLMAVLEVSGEPWALVEVYDGGDRRFDAGDADLVEALLRRY